jgi:hypothetical protein
VVHLAQELVATEAVVAAAGLAENKAKEAAAVVDAVTSAAKGLDKAQAGTTATVQKIQRAADALNSVVNGSKTAEAGGASGGGKQASGGGGGGGGADVGGAAAENKPLDRKQQKALRNIEDLLLGVRKARSRAPVAAPFFSSLPLLPAAGSPLTAPPVRPCG